MSRGTPVTRGRGRRPSSLCFLLSSAARASVRSPFHFHLLPLPCSPLVPRASSGARRGGRQGPRRARRGAAVSALVPDRRGIWGPALPFSSDVCFCSPWEWEAVAAWLLPPRAKVAAPRRRGRVGREESPAPGTPRGERG